MMPHGQYAPNYTFQGRDAQSTPSNMQRRPTLGLMTEVPSDHQYDYNMGVVVSPHPENYSTIAQAQTRCPVVLDPWSNPNFPLETLVLMNDFEPAHHHRTPIGWRQHAASAIRPDVNTTFGMLDMTSSAFTPPGHTSLHESSTMEMPISLPLAECSRGPAKREEDETSLFRQEVGSVALTAASLRRRIDPSHADGADHRCDYCGRSFTRGSTCRDHIRRHLNLREFRCTEADCFEHFNTKGDRDSHLRKIHVRTGAQRAH